MRYDETLTVAQLSKAISTSPRRLRYHIEKGALQVVRDGRRVSIRFADAEEYAQDFGVRLERPSPLTWIGSWGPPPL